MPAAGRLTVQAVYATGTSQLVRDAAARLAGRSDIPAPLASLMGRLRPDNVLVAPLAIGPRPAGVLALGRGPGRPAFSETDVGVAEELGRRIAAGLAQADAAARDHNIAETLQRSALPDGLPEIAGLDLAVRYLPATEGLNVGGDWYDAFPLDGGRVGLVTGDVVGHNIAAASVMGQVRNLLRGYATENPQPADVLRRTSTALARLLPDALATVAYAVLDPAAGELSYASAGHPPPILTTGPGHAEYLDTAAGVMLGVPCETAFTAVPPATGTRRHPAVLHRRAHRGTPPRHHRRPRRPRRCHADQRGPVSRTVVRHGTGHTARRRAARRRRLPPGRPAHRMSQRVMKHLPAPGALPDLRRRNPQAA